MLDTTHHHRDVLVLDLDRRWDQVRVGNVLAEQDESVPRALDVSRWLLPIVSTMTQWLEFMLTFLA